MKTLILFVSLCVCALAQNPMLRDFSCSDAGSTDAYACNLPVALSGYTTGQRYLFKANTANTGAATINFNSLGAVTIKKVAGGITTDLADNDIRAGQWVLLLYDGTNMQMASNLGNALGRTLVAADIPAALANTTSVNGTTIPSSKTLMDTTTSVLAAQMPALTGDCTTSAGAVATTCTKTNGSSFGNAATKNVGTTNGTVAAGDDTRFQTTNQQVRTIGVTFDGGGSAISGTPSSCIPVQTGGLISAMTISADQSGSITVTATYIARTSYTGLASATTAIGSAALSSATQAQTTGLSVTLPADSEVCFAVSGASTVTQVAANLKMTAN